MPSQCSYGFVKFYLFTVRFWMLGEHDKSFTLCVLHADSLRLLKAIHGQNTTPRDPGLLAVVVKATYLYT